MKTYRGFVWTVLATGLPAAVAQTPSEQYYQAIRNNDLSKLGVLVKSNDVNLKDERGGTPLMYAATVGGLDAMKLLVSAKADVNAKNAFDVTPLILSGTDLAKVRFLAEKGANVNAQSKQGRTALLVAAGYDGGTEIVKFLISKGADLAAHDDAGETALLAATGANDTETALLLLQKGANVNTSSLGSHGGGGRTPLINAAAEGNVTLMKALLAKGADVNVASIAEPYQVKNGQIALGLITPLHMAVAFGSPDAVKVLLDAGAKVNAQDVRGMTPLMLAIGTDRANPAVVKLLLDRGADPAIRSKAGENASDWAKKFSRPEILQALGIAGGPVAAERLQATSGAEIPTPRRAAEKSIALLQKTTGSFFVQGACVACHAQNITGPAVHIARANGVKVDEQAAADQLKPVKLQWAGASAILVQGIEVPGATDTITYSLLQFISTNTPADPGIDAMIYNIARLQRAEGNWNFGGIARPPIHDGDFTRTALAIRSFSTYAPPAQKAEYERRIARAAQWLASHDPVTTEDRNMQLLGLKWANAGQSATSQRIKQLIALERPNGGWAQTPYLGADAYATATTLDALHELGIPASDPVFRHGIDFLLRTQLADGSWHVASRAPKFQPYFQSGFPHDHDQWISAAATCWATMALSYAAGEQPLTAAAQ